MRSALSHCLASAVCLLMLALVLAQPAYAYTEGPFRYEIEDEAIIITEYFGRDSEVTVPAELVGYPVCVISAGAFSNNDAVTAVHLPDTIMAIEDGAFALSQSIAYDAPPAPVEPTALVTAEPAVEPTQEAPGEAEPAASPQEATEGATAFPDEFEISEGEGELEDSAPIPETAEQGAASVPKPTGGAAVSPSPEEPSPEAPNRRSNAWLPISGGAILVAAAVCWFRKKQKTK